MKPILAPHKEQDGWRYVRVWHGTDGWADGQPLIGLRANEFNLAPWGIAYDDHANGSRIISSRRVEEAVETADYLKRCDEESIDCLRQTDYTVLPARRVWWVGQSLSGRGRRGKTLREAYHRYKNSTTS